MAKGRKTGGRKPGSTNKATAGIKELARQYAPEAIAELARLAREAGSESVRVGAIKEILDRAFGKACQPLANDPDNPLPARPITIQYVIVDPAESMEPSPPRTQRAQQQDDIADLRVRFDRLPNGRGRQ